MVSPPTLFKPLRVPDFLGIGAQKAGTTWLHKRLSQHRDVWVPPLKEIHYFDVVHSRRDTEMTAMDVGRMEASLRQARRVIEGQLPDHEKLKRLYALSLTGLREHTDEWYGMLFSAAPADRLCGEITPEYALLPDEGIEHILRLNPDMKFILLMRDPIDRGWSAMRMMHDRAVEAGGTADFNRMVNSADFARRADYVATVERYHAHTKPENLLLLYFEDIVERPHWLLEQVCAFLGVDPENARFKKADEPKYQGTPMVLSPELYEKLRETLRPAYERLLSLDNAYVRKWYDKHYANARVAAQ